MNEAEYRPGERINAPTMVWHARFETQIDAAKYRAQLTAAGIWSEVFYTDRLDSRWSVWSEDKLPEPVDRSPIQTVAVVGYPVLELTSGAVRLTP